MRGFFSLSGKARMPLPTFTHFADWGRGICGIDVEGWASRKLSIPTRNKQVLLLTENGADLGNFTDFMATVDASEGANYQEKLRAFLEGCDAGFRGLVVNLNTSNYVSLALVAASEVFVLGVQDQHTETCYVVWATEESDLQALLDTDPLRFLIYRFPKLENDALFFSIETLVYKWHKWGQTHASTLLGFNALERRLFRGTSSP